MVSGDVSQTVPVSLASRYDTIWAMAKKKNISKKHRFKHVESAAAEQGAAIYDVRADGVARSEAPGSTPRSTGSYPAPRSVQAAVAGGQSTRDFSYVAGDLRRIGIMVATLVALQLGLYYALTYTPLGTAINNLVKV